MTVTRRGFLQLSAVSIGFAALERAARGATFEDRPLAPPRGPLALPPGFEQTVISPAGAEMSDGLLVPGYHDGMATFPGAGNTVLFVRNHEIEPAFGPEAGAFGPKLERLAKIDQAKLYDRGFGTPCLGGTTTIVYDPAARRVEKHFLSLTGTGVNCAGGATPPSWGEHSWITCEEWTQKADGKHFEQDHGYTFEVPARADSGLVAPRRLDALGRFKHEAVACDPARPIVYLTEDLGDGCLYRFVGERVGDLTKGNLQALVVVDRASLDTRNWPAEKSPLIHPHERFAARWIDLDEVDAPKDDLRFRAFAAGAARFARCEGIWHGGDAVFFAATTGGAKELGQIWRYVPSPHEGIAAEHDAPATLELFVEPNDQALVKNCDNLTMSKAGEVFVCEDGGGRDGIVRIRPDGSISRFALNVMNNSELAGVCFSPDGQTLFVNVQQPGLTVAITGPWETLKA